MTTDIPRTALVMGGNWDLRTPPENLVLSQESRLRVWALGALGLHGLVDTAIFTAGLTRVPEDTPEAKMQHKFFLEEFPQLQNMKIFEEDLGHTTKMDAIYTRDLVESLGLEGPFSLITTKAFKKRQAKVFKREGLEVVPVVAEPLAASLSPMHTEYVKRYRRSPGHIKWMAVEPILRGLQVIDPDSRITELLAARTRANHN